MNNVSKKCLNEMRQNIYKALIKKDLSTNMLAIFKTITNILSRFANFKIYFAVATLFNSRKK